MADRKMYAWSPILNAKKNVKVGEEVSMSDLDIQQDEWDYLVEAGSVRPEQYPTHSNGDTVSVSPTQHFQDQAAKLASGAYVVEPESPAETPVVKELDK